MSSTINLSQTKNINSQKTNIQPQNTALSLFNDEMSSQQLEEYCQNISKTINTSSNTFLSTKINRDISKTIQLQLYDIKNRIKFLHSFRKIIIEKENELISQMKAISVIFKPQQLKRSSSSEKQQSQQIDERLQCIIHKCENSLCDIKEYLIKMISVFIQVTESDDFQEQKKQYTHQHKKDFNIISQINQSFDMNIQLLKTQVKQKLQILSRLNPAFNYEDLFTRKSYDNNEQIQTSSRLSIMDNSKQTNRQLRRDLNQLQRQFQQIQKERNELLELVDVTRSQYIECKQKYLKLQLGEKQVLSLKNQISELKDLKQNIYKDLNSMKEQILQIISTQVDEYLGELPIFNQRKGHKRIQSSEQLAKVISQTVQKLQKQTKIKEELIQKLEISQTTIKQLKKSKQEINLETILKELNSKNQKMQTLIMQLQQKQLISQMKDKQIANFKEKIRQLRSQIKKMKQKIQTLEEELDIMVQKEQQNGQRIRDLQNIQSFQKQNMEQVQQLKRQLSKFNKQSLKYFKQREKLLEEINTINSQNQQLHNTLKKKQIQISIYQDQVKALIQNFKDQARQKISHKRGQISQCFSRKHNRVGTSESLYQQNQNKNHTDRPIYQNCQNIEPSHKFFESEVEIDGKLPNRSQAKSIYLKISKQVCSIEQKLKTNNLVEQAYVKQLEKKRQQNRSLRKQVFKYKKLSMSMIEVKKPMNSIEAKINP